MKLILSLIVLFTCELTFAVSLEAEGCKQEIVKEALVRAIKSTTFEVHMTSSFQFTGIEKGYPPKFDFIVDIQMNQSNGTKGYLQIAVKVKDSKRCLLETWVLAG